MVEETGKQETVKYLDLDVYTRLCIENFRTLMKRELSLKKAEQELGKWISFIPDKDMKEYVQMTEQIREEYDKKMSIIDDKINEIDIKRGIIKR